MVDNINSLPLNVQDNTDVVIEDNVKSLSSKATENEVINLFQRDILVFDKDETLIHIISADDYNDDVYKRQINKEWSFSFTADVSLSDVIIRKNKIGVYDREGRLQLFIVEDITERYSKTPTMEVYCIHDSFILNDIVLEEFTVTDTIDNVLDSVLAGTSYQRGYTDQFDVADIDMQLTSRFGGLQTIAETFGGELDFRFTLDETRTRILNRYVDVKFSLGRDIGVRFTFDTNLTEVVRTVTSDNHFTVLYGLGRSLATGETKPDGSKEYKRVDFSEVAWGESTGNPTNKPVGQRYIEDTEGIKKWGRIEGIYINETITDPETLINRTWKQLQKCKEPSFSYSVTVEDLSRLTGYEHLSVGIGDTVIIKDEDFKLELSARIQEEQYSIKENIIKALDAESVPMPMSTRAVTGLSSHGGGNKKLVLGVLQRGFTEDNSGSGTVSPPTVDTGSGDVNVDNENFPDVLPATPIISGTGLFATIMTSWTFENSIYYGYELHGSQVENFITSQSTILARGKISSHLHQCKPGERWYFKVRAYNTHGNYTPFSNEIALESSKVADGTEWFENAAIGDALIGQLRLDRGWVGKLTGELIEARNLKVINDNNVDTLHIDNAGNVSLNVSSFSLVQGATSNVPTKNEMTNEINNIEIGGRNLIIRHTETKNTYIDTSGNIVNQNGYATSDYIELVPGGIMAFSKETVSSNDEYFRWSWYDSNKGYISRKAENSNKFKWNVPSGARYARISYHMDCYPKVERGTKHTGWSPSPEDVEYDIKNVSNNLESFENTVNTTFKDGIIEEAEAKAIAQNIKTLEMTHVDMIRDYNIIYANSYLAGTAKTNLASAKTAFDSAHNSLVSTINTVTADGRVTASEKASVDSTFNTYNSVLGTFRERLQEANKYISTAIVDGIQVGSRNYILDSDKSITGTVPGNVSVGGLADWTALQGKTVVASLDINVSGMSNIEGQSNRVGYEMAIMWTDNTMTHIGIWHYVKDGDFKGRKWRTISIPSNKTVKSINYSGMYIQCNATSCVLARPQIEIGNKPTDWSPAVEDMESAYTVVLSNEAQVIPTNNSRVPTVSTTYYTDIQVYKGTTVRTDYSIGTISSANGITVSKTTSRVNFAVSTGTALTADGGTFTIPITIDGKTFNKTFSWSASKQGATGATGMQGPQGEQGPQGPQGVQGSAGADAQYVIVTGEQVFKYANNFSGTPTPSQIALTAQTTGITSPSYQWSYRVPGSTSVTNISGATSSNFTLTHNNSIWGSYKQLTLRCTSSGKYDEITLVKVSDGANGTNGTDGINGVNGADAYTIILTNESHTFPTENDGNIPTALTTTSDIIAYKGATRVSSSVGAVTNPSGLTISASSNGTTSTRLNITASTGTGLSDTGSVAIPITVDGKVFNKTFSWAKAKKGNVGATGSAGKGIKTIAEYYLVSTANTGVTTSTSGWATTVPTLTSTNRYLWNYETITYTDNSTSSTAPKVIGVYGDKGNTGATGATGNGIKSITNYYLVSASDSGITTATSGWTTTMQQTTTTNKYLWNYEVVAYTNDTSYTSIPVIIGTHGATGATGATGAAGTSVESVDIEYYLSTSATTLTGGSWSTTAPSWVNGKYMWSRTKTTLSSGTVTYSQAACITGQQGQTGATGSTGATGTGISSITEEYYLSTSKTTQTGGAWITTPPTWSTGKYLWTRSKIVYTNPSSTAYTTPVCDSSWEAVNDIQISGRNIVLKSNKEITNNEYRAVNYATSELFQVGEQYSVTICVTPAKGVTSFRLYTSSGYKYLAPMNVSGTNKQIVSATFTGGYSEERIPTSPTDAYANLQIYRFPNDDTVTSNSTIHWISVVKGNKPQQDWSPAPEDVQEELNNAVAKVDVMYYLSTSNTSLTGGSWSTTAPAWVDGKYMWQKTVTTLKNGTTIESNPTCITGATGASGSDGKGIKSIVEQYYHSTSMSSLTGGSWSTTAPTPVAGKYIWTRSVITYTDDTTTTTSPICTTGATGATGAAGANAKTLDLTATSLMFTSQDGGISWAPDNGITITATCTNTSVAKWWISPNNGSTWEELTNNGTNSTLTVTRSSFTSRSTTSLLIKCVAVDSTVFDTITIGQIIGYDESKIGNRNLAQKTSDEWVTYSTFNDKDNECILPYNILLKDFVVGDTINIYFKMKFENVVKGTQHTSGTIILQTSGDVTGWEANGNTSKQIEIPSGVASEIEVIHSVKMTADILENDMWFMDFRCDYIKSGAISIKCLMVVNGKLPTAWVPAPEDMIEYVDSSMQSMLASNNDIMDKIYLITSDNYISEAERADFKVTYEQITSQYDTMCWTIDKMNVEYLNTYKTDLTSKYNVVVSVCKPIIENNLDTGAINVRNAIVDFFSSYNNALFAVSTYTKDQLTSISLRVETLNNEFKVSSVRADDAYNATLEMGKHMKFSENWLELYGTVNGASSQFKARLSNEALEFYDGDDVVASISNKKLNIANAEIKHSLTVGRFSISPSAREAGGVVFKYNS